MKIYVRLKDTGSIFHDATQDVSITGSAVYEVENSLKIRSGLSGGVIETVTQEDYDAFKRQQEDYVASVESDSTTLLDRKDAEISQLTLDLSEKDKEIQRLTELLQSQEVELNDLKNKSNDAKGKPQATKK